MTRWWGVDHACGEPPIERVYPELHWIGEGPNDPPVVGRLPLRRLLVCDACGDRALCPGLFEDAPAIEVIVSAHRTADRLSRMAAGYFG